MIFLPSNAMLHDTEPPRAAALPPVMNEEAVALVSRNGFAELVYGLLCYGVRRDIDMQDAAGGIGGTPGLDMALLVQSELFAHEEVFCSECRR